jgi:hypothetical protein
VECDLIEDFGAVIPMRNDVPIAAFKRNKKFIWMEGRGVLSASNPKHLDF